MKRFIYYSQLLNYYYNIFKFKNFSEQTMTEFNSS